MNTKLLTFPSYPTRDVVDKLQTPQVARLITPAIMQGYAGAIPEQVTFIVVGTDYGWLNTRLGALRTWNSYSGARRVCRDYIAARKLLKELNFPSLHKQHNSKES